MPKPASLPVPLHPAPGAINSTLNEMGVSEIDLNQTFISCLGHQEPSWKPKPTKNIKSPGSQGQLGSRDSWCARGRGRILLETNLLGIKQME